MKNDDLIQQAKNQLAVINKEIKKVNDQIQELQLERNEALATYESRKQEVNKGFFGRLWDTVTFKRGAKKNAMEESHQRLHDLDIKLQRKNEKLHQLHFEASALAQKANKEMFEEVVSAGNETIKDVGDVHSRIDDLIEKFETQFQSVNNSFSSAFEGIVRNLKSTNERLEDALGKIKDESKEADQVSIEFLEKTKELEDITGKLDQKIEENKLYTNEQLNSQVEKLNQIKKNIEAQKCDFESAINENQLQIKNTESALKNIEHSFQSKTVELNDGLNRHEEKLSQQNKKIEEYNNDTLLKIEKTDSLLNKTNSELTTFQNLLKGNIEAINNQLSIIDQKLNAQLEQNRTFSELIEEQKDRSIKLKKVIVFGTIVGSLGLIGSIISFLF